MLLDRDNIKNFVKGERWVESFNLNFLFTDFSFFYQILY